FLLSRKLSLLLGDSAATPSCFVELSKADVESAQYGQDQNCEGDDFRAGIDFTDQFAGELAEKYLGIVAARGRRSFHCGLLDKRRYVRIAAPGHERGTAFYGK